MMRRFPPPWSVVEQPACFVVRDHNGQAIAYIYYEDEPAAISRTRGDCLAQALLKVQNLLGSMT